MEKYAFTATLESSDDKLWMTHFAVPELIAKVFTDQGTRRVVCTLNEQVRYQCAINPRGALSPVILVNKKLCTTLRVKPGSVPHVVLERDDSTYGLDMPEEFAAVLEQDEEGNQYFEALTAGKKRTLLYIVSSIKHTDRRIERALAIVEHLKTQQGKIDYKQLYSDLKQSKT
jgi:Bacteriocin-protection, YdeI or OmpD-Associated/Domain of unknown function (DUF1905)